MFLQNRVAPAFWLVFISGGGSIVVNTYLFSIIHITIISILPVGRWPGLGHFHGHWLSDVSLVVDPLSGSGGFCYRLEQKGNAGKLQPQPSGKGRLSSGNVEHDATPCSGEADLGAPVSSRERSAHLWTWWLCLSLSDIPEHILYNWGLTETVGKIPSATLKTFMVAQPDMIVLSY